MSSLRLATLIFSITQLNKQIIFNCLFLGVRCLILLGDKKLIGAGDGTIELVEEKEAVIDTMNKTSKLSTPTYPLFKVVSSLIPLIRLKHLRFIHLFRCQ